MFHLLDPTASIYARLSRLGIGQGTQGQTGRSPSLLSGVAKLAAPRRLKPVRLVGTVAARVNSCPSRAANGGPATKSKAPLPAKNAGNGAPAPPSGSRAGSFACRFRCPSGTRLSLGVTRSRQWNWRAVVTRSLRDLRRIESSVRCHLAVLVWLNDGAAIELGPGGTSDNSPAFPTPGRLHDDGTASWRDA